MTAETTASRFVIALLKLTSTGELTVIALPNTRGPKLAIAELVAASCLPTARSNVALFAAVALNTRASCFAICVELTLLAVTVLAIARWNDATVGDATTRKTPRMTRVVTVAADALTALSSRAIWRAIVVALAVDAASVLATSLRIDDTDADDVVSVLAACLTSVTAAALDASMVTSFTLIAASVETAADDATSDFAVALMIEATELLVVASALPTARLTVLVLVATAASCLPACRVIAALLALTAVRSRV